MKARSVGLSTGSGNWSVLQTLPRWFLDSVSTLFADQDLTDEVGFGLVSDLMSRRAETVVAPSTFLVLIQHGSGYLVEFRWVRVDGESLSSGSPNFQSGIGHREPNPMRI